jgi:hypothetical protein
MPKRVSWVEKQPVVRIDGDSVMVEVCSGDERWTMRISRATFRAFIENGRRLLDGADLAERDKVRCLKG